MKDVGQDTSGSGANNLMVTLVEEFSASWTLGENRMKEPRRRERGTRLWKREPKSERAPPARYDQKPGLIVFTWLIENRLWNR